ncbi:hypothetical protein [Streptomyces sp. NPDC047028]|uniref:hypothetical protein n=1 Tax=Streptomyces sp. NPDC047028 TaxID=3155793 RepID=UPI0033DA7A08
MSLLIVVLVPLSTVALWTQQISDTGRYVALMAPLAHDQDVQDAVAKRVTQEVIARSPRQAFASPGDAAALSLGVRSFTQSSGFPAAWNAAVRATHGFAKQSLIGSSDDDSLGVDLGPVISQVKKGMEAAGDTRAALIPDTHAPVRLLQANSLEVLRGKLHVLSLLSIWLPVATLLLTAGAIVVSDRRLRAVMTVAFSYAIGGLLLWAGVAIFGRLIDNDLGPGVDKPTANTVYEQITSLMQLLAYVWTGAGTLIGVGAWLILIRRARAAGVFGGIPGRSESESGA